MTQIKTDFGEFKLIPKSICLNLLIICLNLCTMKQLVIATKNKIRQLRHLRVRARVAGTATTPRLSVFRGNKQLVAQLIDDEVSKTLCAATTAELKPAAAAEGKSTKVSAAYRVGELIAERAKAKGVTKVIFDRGGYRYHGRVAAVAEGARAGGLQF